MAVEVKEIVIRAILDEEKRHDVPADRSLDKGALIRETVQEVLKVLKKKNRR